MFDCNLRHTLGIFFVTYNYKVDKYRYFHLGRVAGGRSFACVIMSAKASQRLLVAAAVKLQWSLVVLPQLTMQSLDFPGLGFGEAQ